MFVILSAAKNLNVAHEYKLPALRFFAALRMTNEGGDASVVYPSLANL
jgi:hypothetical protein